MPPSIIWLLLTYLLVLGFLTFHMDRWPSKEPLREAWITFCFVPLTFVVFTLFRAGNISSSRDLILTEIWQSGFAWFFLGLSFYRLAGLLEDDSTKRQ